jgi:ATP-binding cassette subfamily B protein
MKKYPPYLLKYKKHYGWRCCQEQRQLLNIARATVAKPAIFIPDVATSSIDTRTELIIQKGRYYDLYTGQFD